MVVEIKNPWGRQDGRLDIQRADLWVVDFSAVLTALTSVLPYNLPTAELLAVSARTVSFPEMRTDADAHRRDNVPNHFPGSDQAFQQVRMTFVLNDARRQTMPAVVALADAWRALVRAGRGQYANGDTTLDLLQAGGGTSLVPRYRADVRVTMLGGGSDTLGEARLDPTAAYTIKNAWFSASQLGDLSQDNSVAQTFTLVLYAEAVIPGSPTGSLRTGFPLLRR